MSIFGTHGNWSGGIRRLFGQDAIFRLKSVFPSPLVPQILPIWVSGGGFEGSQGFLVRVLGVQINSLQVIT
jgi:hypothetical protein